MDDTKKVIYHSNIHSTTDMDAKNKNLDPLKADIPQIICSAIDRGICNTYFLLHDHGEDSYCLRLAVPSPSDAHEEDIEVETKPDLPDHEESPLGAKLAPQIDPEDLGGCIFLLDEQNDGQHFCMHIVKCITEHDKQLRMTPQHIKFRCSVNNDSCEEIILYNKLMDFIQKNSKNNEILWRFKRIVGNQGPLQQGDPHYALSCELLMSATLTLKPLPRRRSTLLQALSLVT